MYTLTVKVIDDIAVIIDSHICVRPAEVTLPVRRAVILKICANLCKGVYPHTEMINTLYLMIIDIWGLRYDGCAMCAAANASAHTANPKWAQSKLGGPLPGVLLRLEGTSPSYIY